MGEHNGELIDEFHALFAPEVLERQAAIRLESVAALSMKFVVHLAYSVGTAAREGWKADRIRDFKQ